MISKSLFLFADIKFLNVIYQLLLQTVLIILHSWDLFQSVLNTSLDLLHTTLLVWLDIRQQLSDIVYLLSKLLLESCSLLNTKVNKTLQGIAQSTFHHIPLLIVECLYISLRQHIWHASEGVNPIFRFRNANLLGNAFQLIIVVFYECCIYWCCVHSTLFLYPHTHIHLSTNESLCHHLTHLHLLLTIKWSDAGLEVKLLRVQRLHLHVDLFVLISYNNIAVASH